jgi:hypothetical protein
MGLKPRKNATHMKSRRRGSATIDYFLLMAVVLPLAAFMMQIAPRMMRSVYDLLTVVVSWPFP